MFSFLRKIKDFWKSWNLAQKEVAFITNPNGLNDTYLFDFKNFASQYNGNRNQVWITNNPANVLDEQTNAKIKVKPIDVLNELETIPTPFTICLIDEKIEILKDKRKLIVQKYAKREVTALIQRLKNRKLYLKHKNFFDGFQNTTDEKIEVLLSKYDLVMKTSDIFIPEFPDDAIKIMKEYTQKVNDICGKKPVFYVIATSDNFKSVDKKRDPILLAQSPFGFYWQILGAWDKEMLLLSEL
jgi:hypothetical protein